MNDTGNIVADTIAEINDGPDRPHALARLRNWQERVHRLYDDIEVGLGPGYVCDRTGKHQTQEEIIQRAGVMAAEIPSIDILRIERPREHLRAVIQPRHLWIVGANGRLDLVVLRKNGIGRRVFQLLDLSRPMSSVSDWRLVWGGEPLDQPCFTIERLRELVE